ncbi:MAG: hypothetical protein ABEH59_12440 [Halobacteriales archaeon]
MGKANLEPRATGLGALAAEPVMMSSTQDDGAPQIVEWADGVTWIAEPGKPIQRASHALLGDDGVWIVDPVDVEEIHAEIDALGDVAGVTVLIDRHKRDASAFARRYDVPVYVPTVLGDALDDAGVPVETFEGGLGRSGYRSRPVVSNRIWREAALVSHGGKTVVVPEALGRNDFCRAPDERVGVHPGLRLWPPRQQLGDLDPERLLVGHGPPLGEDAGAAIQDTLAGARRRAPRAFLRMVTSLARS